MGTEGRHAAAPSDEQIIIDLRARGTAVLLDTADIPFLDLAKHHEPIAEEVIEAWRSLLDSGAFIGGSAVESFESELAEFVGVAHAVGVANGTDAIMLALRALGIEKGDEVIIPANTFFATAEAVVHAGGVPVLVDALEDTATIDPAAVEAAITRRTRFIIPVHLYGQPADMDEIMAIAAKHDLMVVEDNAQAIGAQYKGVRTGAIGHAGATSFYPGKNLGAAGDGGAVTTNIEGVANDVRMLASHGSYKKYDHSAIGYNSRLDALQAALLSVKLRRLDVANAMRRHAAERYATLIHHPEIAHPAIASDRNHVFHLYVVRMDDRDTTSRVLSEIGISTGLHYPTPLHLTEPFRHLGGGQGNFPVSEAWASRGLSLPMFPELTENQIETVAIGLVAAREDIHVLARSTA